MAILLLHKQLLFWLDTLLVTSTPVPLLAFPSLRLYSSLPKIPRRNLIESTFLKPTPPTAMELTLQIPLAALVFPCIALVIIAIRLGFGISDQVEIAADGRWVRWGKEGWEWEWGGKGEEEEGGRKRSGW